MHQSSRIEHPGQKVKQHPDCCSSSTHTLHINRQTSTDYWSVTIRQCLGDYPHIPFESSANPQQFPANKFSQTRTISTGSPIRIQLSRRSPSSTIDVLSIWTFDQNQSHHRVCDLPPFSRDNSVSSPSNSTMYAIEFHWIPLNSTICYATCMLPCLTRRPLPSVIRYRPTLDFGPFLIGFSSVVLNWFSFNYRSTKMLIEHLDPWLLPIACAYRLCWLLVSIACADRLAWCLRPMASTYRVDSFCRTLSHHNLSRR